MSGKEALPENDVPSDDPPTETDAASEDPTPVDDWVDPILATRRRRWRLIAIAGVLTACLVAVLMRGVVRTEPSPRSLPSPAKRLAEQVRRAAEGPGRTLLVNGYAIDDAMWTSLDLERLPDLENVIVELGRLTDASIPSLVSVPGLRHLRLRHSPITDEGLRRLAEGSQLRILNLPHASVTSEGLSALEGLTTLRFLRIGSPTLSGDAARVIERLTHLRQLHLIGVPITDEGLRRIAALPRLESLYLDDTAVTDAGWRWLFQRHPHLHVHIDSLHHDDDPGRHQHRTDDGPMP